MRVLRQYRGAIIGALSGAGFLYQTARLCGIDSPFPPEAERNPFLYYPLVLAMYASFALVGASLGKDYTSNK